MKLNPDTARREMKAQRWPVKDMATEIELDRTVLSSYLSGARQCTDVRVIQGLARVLNVSPYVLLGPEDPKAATLELCAAYGVTSAEIKAMERERAA